ncbi:hypothetical protein [Bacillus sp. JCM 19041]|uniref:hypothetical protein n=1 Tax=Bacillus sp. JCM 19041 TaxID=1460637 RepID=UPI0006D1CA71
MVFIILMAGTFMIISLKSSTSPIFSSKNKDFIHLAAFTCVLSLVIVNGTFVKLVPDWIVFLLALCVTVPLAWKLFTPRKVSIKSY